VRDLVSVISDKFTGAILLSYNFVSNIAGPNFISSIRKFQGKVDPKEETFLKIEVRRKFLSFTTS
jgi:hypothetical protein